MENDQLLVPRIRCIHNDWQGWFKKDDIFIATRMVNNSWRFYFDNDYPYLEENEIKEYPHLFTLLEWWQDRELKDMPQYVKYNNSLPERPQWISLDESNPSPTSSDLELFKVEKWVEHMLYGDVRQVSAIWKGDFEIGVSWLIPATEAEYLAHINI